MRERDSPIEQLHDELRRLNDGLELIYDVLGEIRVDLQWALQNGRVVLHLPADEPRDPAADPGRSNILHLVVRLGDALSEMKNQMRDAIANAADHHLDADEWEADDGETESVAAALSPAGSRAGPVTSESDERESDPPRMDAALRPTCHVQRSLFDIEQAEAVCERIDASRPEGARPREEARLVTVSGVVPGDELKRLLEVTLFDPGDTVVLDCEPGELVEVVSVDDARNSAEIASLRTGHRQTVSQDRLSKRVDAPRGREAEPQQEQSPEATPYTLAAYWSFESRLHAGQLSVEELRWHYKRLSGNREAFIDNIVRELRSRVLSELMSQFGCKVLRGRNARRRNAEAIYCAILRVFALGTVDDVASEDLEGVVDDAIEEITEAELDAFAGQLPGGTPVVNPSFRGV